jgi:hypothetical protein
MPTAADIDKMDAASAERSVRSLGLLPTDSSIVWLIDGVVSTAAAAKALSPGSIAEVSVNKAAPDGAHIDIVTKLGRQSCCRVSRRIRSPRTSAQTCIRDRRS